MNSGLMTGPKKMGKRKWTKKQSQVGVGYMACSFLLAALITVDTPMAGNRAEKSSCVVFRL